MLASATAGHTPVTLRRQGRATRGQTGELRTIPGLRPRRFDAAEMERISSRSLLIPAGSYLVRQGYPFYDLYAVRSGRIQASVRDAEGRVDVLRDFLPGEVIGLAALAGGRYGSDFQAVETSVVCTLPLELFGDLYTRLRTNSRKRF